MSDNESGEAVERAQQESASPVLDELKPQAETEVTAGKGLDIEMILDVNLNVAIELGRTGINIRDLLALSQGSILELDRMAGEALDVRVNGTLVARGEVVVVKDKFGLMLTEVVSPEERIRRLH